LAPDEQALEAGCIVVFCQENYSQAVWTALQRTQEAEWFVRHQFASAPPSNPFDPYHPTVSPITVGKSFLHGGSWGQIVSGILATLQPKTYSASANWISSDVGYGIGDYAALLNQMDQFFARGADGPLTSPGNVAFYSLVDALGTRFDSPKFGRPGWDLAALSMNRRPNDLQAHVFGGVGDVDYLLPAAWSRGDTNLGTLGTFFHPNFFRNHEHLTLYGHVPGVNEYSNWQGNEWANVVATAVANPNPATANTTASPTSTAPTKPYPDPYSHTLRHYPHVPAPGNPTGLLTAADVTAVSGFSTPSYTKSGATKWIG
jgi:hypothetical protein